MIQYTSPSTISGTLMHIGLAIIINNTFLYIYAYMYIVKNQSVLTQLTGELQ